VSTRTGTETPSPITTADVWNLHASPASLAEAAAVWRSLATTAQSAQEKVTAAAHSVLSTSAWEGEAADAYDEHQRKLTADLGELGTLATAAADALDAAAACFAQLRIRSASSWRR